MRIVIAENGSVGIEDPEVFTSFLVAAFDPGATTVLDALGHSGAPAPESDHVFVAVSTVRALAGRLVDDSWEDAFAKMLAYAESQGWTGDDGRLLKAHIEPIHPEKD